MDISPIAIILLILAGIAAVILICLAAARYEMKRTASFRTGYHSVYIPPTTPAAPLDGSAVPGGRTIPAAAPWTADPSYRFGAAAAGDSADKSEALYTFYRDVPPACCPSCGVEYPGSLGFCPVCGHKR